MLPCDRTKPFTQDERVTLNAQTLFQEDLITFDMENVTFIENRAFALGKKGEKNILYALRRNNEKDYNLFTVAVLTGGRRLTGRFWKSIDFQFLSEDTIILRTFRYNPYKSDGHGREFQEEYCMCVLKDYYIPFQKRISEYEENTIRCKQYSSWITIQGLNIEEGRNLWRSTDDYRKMVEIMENNRKNNLQRKTEPSLSKEDKQHNKTLRRTIRGLKSK